MIDCKVCCKNCEQTLCRYAGAQRGLEVDCRYYVPRQKPQTNADRIRAMSDEELAACFGGRGLCSYIQDETDFCESRAVCRDCILDWLQQPVKDGEE